MMLAKYGRASPRLSRKPGVFVFRRIGSGATLGIQLMMLFMHPRWAILFTSSSRAVRLIALAFLAVRAVADEGIPQWFPKAPPLPQPQDEVIRVEDASELLAAVDRIKPGGTILIADG